MVETLAQLVRSGSEQLRQTLQLDSHDARLEAQLLLAHAVQADRVYLISHNSDPCPAPALAVYRDGLQRRLAGEPLAYILGYREFYGLVLAVTPAVLIPRPETETLVDEALARVATTGQAAVADLGTGSGAIALAIAAHRPDANVTAVDRSAEALAVAEANARRLDIRNVRFRQSDWLEGLAGQQFHLIASNPPYVADQDPHLLAGGLPFEPAGALKGGQDGLDCIRRIVRSAPEHLYPAGWLLIEHGYDQAEACRALMQAQGLVAVHSVPDLAGIPRITLGQKDS